MLTGSVLGLGVVFSSGIYISLLTTGQAIGGYRHLNFNTADSLAQMVYRCCVQLVNMPYRLWENNLILSMSVLAVMAVVLMFFHGVIYAQIGACKAQREAMIAQAVENNEKVIVLSRYPYEEYLWHPDPDREGREEYFKRFYKIDDDVEVIFEEPS